MRKIIENQLKIGQVDIANIELDLRSRDEIPQLLLGLHAIYKNRQTRRKVFAILEQIVPEDVDTDNGRHGIDLDANTIKVIDSKGRDRFVPMTSRIKDLFESMGPGSASVIVFPARKGKVQGQVPSSFKRALVDSKINEGIEDRKLKASFHTLRHTYASRLVQSGVDLYRVQRLLGHSTPVMTARYSKLADSDLKEAVATMEKASMIKKRKGGKVINFRIKA